MKSDQPRHLQVAERIKGLIARKYAPGDVLPTYLQLARRFSVGLVTVTKAMDVLAAKDIVTPIRRKGTVVNRRIQPGEVRLSQVGLVVRCALSRLFDERHLSEIVGALCRKVDSFESDLRIFSLSRSAEAPPPKAVVACGVDGVILLGAQEAEYIKEFARWGVPLVVLDHYLADVALDYVVCDNAAAAVAVVEHLAALGHRRIAYVDMFAPAPFGLGPDRPEQAPAEESDRVERRGGFVAAMRASLPEMPAPVLTFTDTGPERHAPEQALDEMTAALRSGPEAPSAAVANDENTAVKLIAHMIRRGIRVPADISVAAVAGADMTAPEVPPLTYCQFDFPAMGARGMDLLDLRTRTPRPQAPHIDRIGFEFHVGNTTAPPPRRT